MYVYDHEVSFADDFLDVTEMLTEEEIDEKNTNEEYSNCEESSQCNETLYRGCCLSFEINVLLVVTFCIRHALSGVALADFLTLIELHCLLPSKCAKTTKLLRDFFGKLKSPIELHYYCLYCQEYFGTRKPKCCWNAACLCDFERKGSHLQYFIVIPFVTQLQAIIKGKCKSDSTIRNLCISYIYHFMCKRAFLGGAELYFCLGWVDGNLNIWMWVSGAKCTCL